MIPRVFSAGDYSALGYLVYREDTCVLESPGFSALYPGDFTAALADMGRTLTPASPSPCRILRHSFVLLGCAHRLYIFLPADPTREGEGQIDQDAAPVADAFRYLLSFVAGDGGARPLCRAEVFSQLCDCARASVSDAITVEDLAGGDGFFAANREGVVLAGLLLLIGLFRAGARSATLRFAAGEGECHTLSVLSPGVTPLRFFYELSSAIAAGCGFTVCESDGGATLTLTAARADVYALRSASDSLATEVPDMLVCLFGRQP